MRNSANITLTATRLFVVAFISLLLHQPLSAQVKKPGGKPGGARPSASKSSGNRPEANRQNTRGNDQGSRSGVNNSGNRANNVSGNNVNVDKSRKNVNVNIDNSKDIHVNNVRNTSVRRNTRVYPRPPYVYGGRRYMCYHPYFFHPYRPFVWGPVWHPWGFFVATLATTAIIVSIVDNDVPNPADMAWNNFTGAGLDPVEKQLLYTSPGFVAYSEDPVSSFHQGLPVIQAASEEYYYDQGVFYIRSGEGYTVVAAPVGAKVKSLPSGYETVVIDEKTTNYYYGGAFYEKRTDGYVVVAPMAGAVVEHISEGGEEVKMGDQTFVKFGETYFQPIQKDGKNMYEVANVEEDK